MATIVTHCCGGKTLPANPSHSVPLDLGPELRRSLSELDDRTSPGGSAGYSVGMMMLWTRSVATIPIGWAVMDGVANSIANGGSGINLSGYFIKCHATTAGTTTAAGNTGSAGGHDHGAATGSGGTGSTSSAGSHDHGAATGSGGTGSSGSATTGITVAAHPEHYHLATADGCVEGSIAISPVAVWAFASVGSTEKTSGVVDASSVSLSLTHSVTDSGHTHTGPSHTHTISSGGDHTHTGPSHTHTITSEAAHTHTAGEPANVTAIPIEYIGA